jgi:hypothetical protein
MNAKPEEPIQWPCGHEGEPDCPPVQCVKILAKLTKREQAAIHRHFQRCYDNGRKHEKEAQRACKKGQK